jgi:hypothetical protein
MMSRKNGIGQIIKAFVAVMTFIALTSRFRVIKATFDDLFRLTRGTLDAVWLSQLAYRLITLNIIDEMLDIDLQHGTPVWDREMGWHQYTPFSNATTPESNMSVQYLTTVSRHRRKPDIGFRLSSVIFFLVLVMLRFRLVLACFAGSWYRPLALMIH